MSVPLEESYRYCRDVARRRARNFYYSFVLLPAPKRAAMCSIYAFMRYCDDLSDEPGAERQAIDLWRGELGRALEGRCGDHPLWPAFEHTVRTFRIPHQYFYDMIEGVTSDLAPRRIRTFDELYRYCYQVASVVGLTIIHIFGFESPDALPLAEKCGVAFQLTNILRDVREDAVQGRVYLPSEDLERYGVAPAEFCGGQPGGGFLDLMRFEAARARAYYNAAKPLVGMVDPSSRSSLWALIEIYARLLARIESTNFDVLRRRVSLPTWEKILIVARGALFGPKRA